MSEKFCFQEIKNRIITELVSIGVNSQQAETFADCLATADLYGVSSHGSRLLPAYVDKIKRGDFNLSPDFKVHLLCDITDSTYLAP